MFEKRENRAAGRRARQRCQDAVRGSRRRAAAALRRLLPEHDGAWDVGQDRLQLRHNLGEGGAVLGVGAPTLADELAHLLQARSSRQAGKQASKQAGGRWSRGQEGQRHSEQLTQSLQRTPGHASPHLFHVMRLQERHKFGAPLVECRLARRLDWVLPRKGGLELRRVKDGEAAGRGGKRAAEISGVDLCTSAMRLCHQCTPPFRRTRYPLFAHLEQLVDNHGEGVDVDAGVVGLVAEHLGGHVAVRPCGGTVAARWRCSGRAAGSAAAFQNREQQDACAAISAHAARAAPPCALLPTPGSTPPPSG